MLASESLISILSQSMYKFAPCFTLFSADQCIIEEMLIESSFHARHFDVRFL